MQWVEVSVGDLIEIPSNAKHTFRNRSQNPVLNLLLTTSKHGRYFQEIGRPLASGESVSCRVKFKAPRNAIVFRTADLDRPFTSYNAELLAMLGGQLEISGRVLDSRCRSHGGGDLV